MGIPQNLLEAWNFYQANIAATHSLSQAKSNSNETQSAIMRILVPALGYQHKSVGKKMTRAEIAAAQEFMKTQKISELKQAGLAVEEFLNTLNITPASRNTYGSRIKKFLTWCEDQPWYQELTVQAGLKSKNDKADRCPPANRGHGKTPDKRVTDRRSVYKKYKLQKEDISTELRAELQDLYLFLSTPERNDRKEEDVGESTAEIYLEDIYLMLGWFRLKKRTPKKELSLDLLIPRVTEDILSSLEVEQQETIWNVRKLYIETWLCQHFEFLRNEGNSRSPNTKRFKLHALTALVKFQYRTEVDSISDYQKNPILRTVSKYSAFVRHEVKQWNRQGIRVVPLESKWPDIIDGETALTTVRKQVVEELRLSCKPRWASGGFKGGKAITTSIRNYLAWSFLTNMPARRQEELRSFRISLTCPVKRPEDLPREAFYHPLPPDIERERDKHNLISDNYLYKTFVRKGKLYPEGIWVLDIQKYKTRKRYGPQSIIIKNIQFADGSCFYDYLEHYLYGWWKPASHVSFSHDFCWDSSQKTQGRWVSLGRSEFEPVNPNCISGRNSPIVWSWGFFFVMPQTGQVYESGGFESFFKTAAHKIIGKPITPHILRDMWATWAYQIGLSDAQRESLAYAMGLDEKTLREVYERCSPSEKRRPIEEVIDRVLFGELEQEYHQSDFYLQRLTQDLLSLPEQERLKYLKILSL